MWSMNSTAANAVQEDLAVPENNKAMGVFMIRGMDQARLFLKRINFRLQLTALPVALLLTACATQTPPIASIPAPTQPTVIAPPPVSAAEQEALRSLISLQDRLYRVAAPLLVNNTELC